MPNQTPVIGPALDLARFFQLRSKLGGDPRLLMGGEQEMLANAQNPQAIAQQLQPVIESRAQQLADNPELAGELLGTGVSGFLNRQVLGDPLKGMRAPTTPAERREAAVEAVAPESVHRGRKSLLEALGG